MEKKDSYNIGDWVVNSEDKFVRITSHDMPELPFEKIRFGVSKEDVKQAIYDRMLTNEEIEKQAFDVLEKRMYIFVPYNISDIQKGIQAGHAVEQYVFNHGDTLEYHDYINNHKTWIILNGGTTNSHRDFDGVAYGSLNKITDELADNEINFGYFCEPDLNDSLTAICFLCDERVFNWKQFPDFISWTLMKDDFTKDMIENQSIIDEYTEFVGGEKIKFLKELIYKKSLA